MSINIAVGKIEGGPEGMTQISFSLVLTDDAAQHIIQTLEATINTIQRHLEAQMGLFDDVHPDLDTVEE